MRANCGRESVKRCIEQWILWLAVDAIEMFMWWHTGADSMAILAMWTLFFVDGCYCYALWLRKPENFAILKMPPCAEPKNLV